MQVNLPGWYQYENSASFRIMEISSVRGFDKHNFTYFHIPTIVKGLFLDI